MYKFNPFRGLTCSFEGKTTDEAHFKNFTAFLKQRLGPPGGIYVTFPDYKVDTGMGFKAPLGHGMVISVNDKTGKTRGSEYGRYDPNNRGIARRVRVPDLIASDPSNPTKEELDNYAKQLDKYYGHSGGTTKVTYIPDADEATLVSLMESAEKNRPNSFYQNREYNILDHNCGTYAADMLKKAVPWWAIVGRFGLYTHGTPSMVEPIIGTKGSYTSNQ